MRIHATNKLLACIEGTSVLADPYSSPQTLLPMIMIGDWLPKYCLENPSFTIKSLMRGLKRKQNKKRPIQLYNRGSH